MNRFMQVYQNAKSNTLLNWVHNRLVELKQSHLTMVADILMSQLIQHNAPKKDKKQAISKGSSNNIWDYCLDIDVQELAEQVYPKGSVDSVKRYRQRWAEHFIKACIFLADNDLLLVWADVKDGSTLRVQYHEAVRQCKAVSIPSPLNLPVQMYRFPRHASSFPTYAFIIPRKLAVDEKMNPDKYKGDYISMEVDTFCNITGLPQPSEMRSSGHRWPDGIKAWNTRVGRSCEHFDLYRSECTPDGDCILIVKIGISEGEIGISEGGNTKIGISEGEIGISEGGKIGISEGGKSVQVRGEIGISEGGKQGLNGSATTGCEPLIEVKSIYRSIEKEVKTPSGVAYAPIRKKGEGLLSHLRH